MVKEKIDIEAMTIAGKIARSVREYLIEKVKPGISTAELNDTADYLFKKYNVVSAFKNYPGKKSPYPSSICTSVNEEIVHGIPKKEKILQKGDILSIDLGIWYAPKAGRKVCVDTAITVGVGAISPNAMRLINAAKEALTVGVSKVKEGAFIADISQAIQKYVEYQGFSVIRDLVGHGVGYKVHEPPSIPNFWESSKKNNNGIRLKTGMTIAIEPMISAGSYKIAEANDGWTLMTKDKSLSAHFEHTVLVTKHGSKILT